MYLPTVPVQQPDGRSKRNDAKSQESKLAHCKVFLATASMWLYTENQAKVGEVETKLSVLYIVNREHCCCCF